MSQQWKLKQDIIPKKLEDSFYVRRGDLSSYKRLKEFHYIDSDSTPIGGEIYGLFNKSTDIIYGVAVFTVPIISIRARTESVLGRALKKCSKDRTEYAQRLNKLAIYGRRIILHPSVRGVGLAPHFLNEVHKLIQKPFIEHMSLMSYHHNFLPNNYDYFIRVKRLAQLDDFFSRNIKSKSGIPSRTRIQNRLKTAEQNYGYALYIKRDILKKPEYSKYLQ